MEEYKERKAMMQAGIIPPRKPRTRKPKVNEAMLEMLEKEFGLSREAVLAKMAPPAPALPISLPVPVTCTADMVHAYFTRVFIERIPYATVVKGTLDDKGTVQAIFRWEFEYLKHHDHADADWWEKNLPTEQEEAEPVVIAAEYIEKLQAEAREIGKKNPSKKTKKAPAKKTTAKKAPAKKTTAKKTTKKANKKEAVA